MDRLNFLLRRASLDRTHANFERRAEDAPPDGERLSAAQLDRIADRFARRLLASLPEGATRALVVTTPEPAVVAAVAGVQRAGLTASFASPSLAAPEIAAAARRLGAHALLGPRAFGGLDMASRLRAAAAEAPELRAAALWSPGAEDDLELIAPGNVTPLPSRGRSGAAARFADSFGVAAAARAFVDQLKLAGGDLVVSLLTPTSPAGFLAGVLAPLQSGADLVWQAPFSARRLAELLGERGPAHLVAPAAIAPALGAAGLLGVDGVATLTLIAPRGQTPPLLAHDLDPARIFTMWTARGKAPALAPWSR